MEPAVPVQAEYGQEPGSALALEPRRNYKTNPGLVGSHEQGLCIACGIFTKARLELRWGAESGTIGCILMQVVESSSIISCSVAFQNSIGDLGNARALQVLSPLCCASGASFAPCRYFKALWPPRTPKRSEESRRPRFWRWWMAPARCSRACGKAVWVMIATQSVSKHSVFWVPLIMVYCRRNSAW